VVFHFSDADPAGTASDYLATVQTGDATLTSAANPSNVQIVANGSAVDDKLDYPYGEQLTSQTFGVSVTDHAATATASTSTFRVAYAALTARSLPPPLPSAYTTLFSSVVFHFTDADPAGTAGDYVATVQTGDATLTSTANPGNVQVVANG